MTHHTTANPTQATVTITATVAELQNISRALIDAAWVVERTGRYIYHVDDRTIRWLEQLHRIAEDAETKCLQARPSTDDGDAAPGAPRYPYDNGDGDGS